MYIYIYIYIELYFKITDINVQTHVLDVQAPKEAFANGNEVKSLE